MERVMRIVCLFAMLFAISSSSFAQTAHKGSVRLKTTDLGNQQLYYSPDTDTYHLQLKTGHDADPYVTVMMGSKTEALKLLNFLQEQKLSKGDWVDFENVGENTATWFPPQYRVTEKGNPWTGNLRKENIKAFIKEIEKHEN